MRFLVLSILASLAIGGLVYVLSGGRVVFLPFVLLFPFVLFPFGRRRRGGRTWP
jgi:hypothetical protein